MVQRWEGRDGCCWEQFDPSGRLGAGRGGVCVSALHPKVLCELLDLQQVFSVDCGPGGGQRAQHVRLQVKKRQSHACFASFILSTQLNSGLKWTQFGPTLHQCNTGFTLSSTSGLGYLHKLKYAYFELKLKFRYTYL